MISSCLTITGCYKDLGNYDYEVLNKFALSNLSQQIVVQGDTLRLNPTLEEDIPDSTRFDYKWTFELNREQIAKMSLDSNAIIIGRKKELLYVIPINIPADTYILKAEAVDRNTGIRKFTTTSVQITVRYQRGYMLLEETDQGGDISLVVNKGLVYRHVFSENNEGKYLPTPLNRLLTANALMDRRNKKILFVSAAGFNKELDEQSFRVIRDINDIFIAPYGKPLVPMYLEALSNRTLYSAFVWDNGLISNVVTGSTNVLAATYDYPLAGDYKLAPFLAHFGGRGFIGFDEKNGRFLSFDNWRSTSGITMSTFLNVPTTVFDINNIKKKMIYGSNIFQDRYFVGLFKDVSGRLSMYELDFTDIRNKGAQPIRTYTIDLTKVPHIDKASCFTASYLLPFLYYAVDNTLYLFDVHNHKADPIYSFQPGERITTLEWANKEGTRQIAISTYNGSEGKFYVFLPSGSGSLELPAQIQEGGFGKIIHTHIKFSSASPNPRG
ncbi:PKD-like family lipoprotein [Sphingobacterium griseoflavum]|nr:PKD-like family lipoprotein [Sphingobacterium griseoflavum]